MRKILCTLFIVLQTSFIFGQLNITYAINTGLGRTAISPYVYGNNLNEVWSRTRSENITARRIGGNRLTTYNWEHNFSNAGNDWGPHATDTYLFIPIGIPVSTSPGRIYTAFHDTSLVLNTYSLLTLQAGGYVAKNTAKNVTTNPPSADWDRIQLSKGAAFTLTPSVVDGVIYIDEMLNFLINRYNTSATATGIKGYCIDNEADLWSSTHSRMHSTPVTCQEITTKTIDYAKVVKAMDPTAEIFGPVSYGYWGYRTCQSASDWNGAGWTGYPWFLDGYLDKMKTASTTFGSRLLDVLDIHYYTEHRGTANNGTKYRVFDEAIQSYDADNGIRTARMQSPRSLWDPTFIEDSWIATVDGPAAAISLIPTLKSKIATRYAGTKLAITEYDFGAEDDISGGIATVDALGIYGKYDVYMANYWGELKNYVSSAFKLYRNYDGIKSTYENTNVQATTTDIVNSTVYASVNSGTNAKLHIIVTNKNLTNTINGTFNITSTSTYTSAKVYGFRNGLPNITLNATIVVTGNSFNYTLPALSAIHIVLEDPTALPVDIIDFSGKCNSNKEVELNWKVSSETAVKGYEIEKSSTKDDWAKVGFVNAINNTSSQYSYNFNDQSENNNAFTFYRLKTIDLSGSQSLSDIIEVKFCNGENSDYTIYPNPSNTSFNLKTNNSDPVKIQVTVKDITGRILSASEYLSMEEIILGENLPHGMYILEVRNNSNDKIEIFKIIKTN